MCVIHLRKNKHRYARIHPCAHTGTVFISHCISSEHARPFTTYCFRISRFISWQVPAMSLEEVTALLHSRQQLTQQMAETARWPRPSRGWRVLNRLSLFRNFPNFSELSKHWLPVLYHVHVWEVSAAETPVKYERDLKNLLSTCVRSNIQGS